MCIRDSLVGDPSLQQFVLVSAFAPVLNRCLLYTSIHLLQTEERRRQEAEEAERRQKEERRQEREEAEERQKALML